MLLYNIHILSYTSIINAHTHNTYTYTHTHKQGSSAGKIGPVVGKVLQDVRLEEGVYDNIVSLGGGAFKGTLQATWKNKSKSLWEVKFQTLTLSLLGIKLKEQELNQIGIWRMTYLDDNFR